MLEDKRAAADACARLVARMKQDHAAPSAAPETEKPVDLNEGMNGGRGHWMRPFRAHLLSGAATGVDDQTTEASLLEALGLHDFPKPKYSPPLMPPIVAALPPVADESYGASLVARVIRSEGITF
jgi:hypothetical protein